MCLYSFISCMINRKQRYRNVFQGKEMKKKKEDISYVDQCGLCFRVDKEDLKRVLSHFLSSKSSLEWKIKNSPQISIAFSDFAWWNYAYQKGMHTRTVILLKRSVLVQPHVSRIWLKMSLHTEHPMNSGAGPGKLHKAVLMEISDTTKESVYMFLKCWFKAKFVQRILIQRDLRISTVLGDGPRMDCQPSADPPPISVLLNS